jgi:uncharacterized protein (DUF1800 family)
MRKTALVALAASACLAVFPAIVAIADTKDPARLFAQEIPRDERVPQALSRLTYGARPGDVAAINAMGLKKWLDQQLHPEQIAENPVLEAKLKLMDTLSMSASEMVRDYPSPQVVRQMLNGQMPFPSDPDRRMMIQKLAAKEEEKLQGKNGVPPGPPNPMGDPQKLRDLLTQDQIRALRTGTSQDRVAVVEGLSPDKQAEVIEAMPGPLRQALFAAAPAELRRKLEMASGPAQVVARDLTESKMLRAIYSNRQLAEVMDDFWFNHFNIYLDKNADRYLVTEYERDTIRPRVFGKFRDLLEATAKSPAMLFYLDNWQSVGPNAPQPRGPNAKGQKRGLNENYGRELMELHTLGVDSGYTQNDVTEVARCFTGWTINQPQRGGKFTFNPRLHDDGEKVVLGVKIPAGGGMSDGEKVLDILAHHPATAHFISKKLAQRFVADDPPEALVTRMAQTFTKTDGDIRAVMQTMLDSKEFWSEGAWRTKVKSPLEMVASAVRAVNGDVDFAAPLVNQLTQLGQPLYRKVEPTGYSNSSKEWLNSAGLVARMNFALQLASNKVPGVKVDAQADNQLAGIPLGSPEFQKR